MPFSVTSTGTPACSAANRTVWPSASGYTSQPVCMVATPSGTGSWPSGPMRAREYVCTPTKSSSAETDSQSVWPSRRASSHRSSPPSAGWRSTRARVHPVLTVPAVALIACTARRCACCHLLEARRHDPHPITGRVVPSDPTVSLLDGLGCGRSGLPSPMARTPVLRIIAIRLGSFSVHTHGQEVADVLGHRSGVGGEPFRRVRRAPTASSRHPAGDREVVVGHDWRDALVQAALDHPLVMVECGARVEARLRFDS